MNAGQEAHHRYDDKNEVNDGTAAEPDSSGTEQRVEGPPLSSGSEGSGVLPAPSGIICLSVIAGRHQCPADPVQLVRALGLNPASPVSKGQILLAAKELGLKAKAARTSWDGLPRRSLPFIAELTTGEFVVLLRADPDGRILVGNPHKTRPEQMDRERFEAIWSGQIVLIKSRLRLDNRKREAVAHGFGVAVG